MGSIGGGNHWSLGRRQLAGSRGEGQKSQEEYDATNAAAGVDGRGTKSAEEKKAKEKKGTEIRGIKKFEVGRGTERRNEDWPP